MAKGKCCKTIEEALIFATSTIKFFERMHAVAHNSFFFRIAWICLFIYNLMYVLSMVCLEYNAHFFYF